MGRSAGRPVMSAAIGRLITGQGGSVNQLQAHLALTGWLNI